MPLSVPRNLSNALLVIFIILTLCLLTVGYILFLHQKTNMTFEKHNELAAINKLKIEQAANWRNNLLSNAKTIYYDQPVITHLHELNLGINPKSNNQIVSEWVKSLLEEFEYTKALLVNPAGKVIMNTNPGEPLTEPGKLVIAQSIQKKGIVISDLSLYNGKTICIYMAVPLYLEVEKREKFSGVALLNIDPEKYLYPIFQNWPTTKLTGETQIYRREGDSVIFLNEPRHHKNGALHFRLSLKDTLLPAVRGVMGHRGTIEGVDYRGVAVFADVDTVANTPWIIVSKIDKDEVLQPIHKQAIYVFSIIFLLIFVCALIIYLIWKSHTAKLEQERQALLKHFDYVVKYANDIIILCDFNGNICQVNDKTISEYGYSRDEILKINIKQLRPPETKNAVDKLLGLLDKNEGILYETIHIRKNGEIFPIESSSRRMEIEGKKYYQFIIRDITERKKIEEALIKAKEKAEESDRLKTAFLNNMSHEIRTPMNGILGFSELLDDETLSQEERKQYINIIHNNSVQLLSIINDIIDISKIHSNQLTLSTVSFNLHDLLDELFITFEQEKILKGKTDIRLFLEQAFDENNSTILSDDDRIRQILNNLLSNAVKFTKTGFIKFGYKATNGKLQFFVQDTGKGIAKEKQSFIFERFRQEEDTYTREFGGTGLGLSISKGLVELLGGDMWLFSDEGMGTTFYFTIPYNTEQGKKVAIKNVVSQDKEDPQIKQLKILIVEDNETSELLLTTIVKKYCKEDLHARTGVEAVEACRNNPDIDLVLMDIQMPEMNGYYATREIRKFNKTVIIIAQTAYALEGDREKALEAGCNDYISKPISQVLLKELVNRHFNK
jgi:PAS domain S-box-containing protein